MSAQRQPDRLGRRILWGVIFGVVVYGVLAAVTDVRTVGSTLAAFPVATFVAALGLSVGNYAVRWAKWHYYLRHLGFAVPVGESVVVFLAGLTMSITPGKVGEVLKSVLLHQSRGTSIAATAPIVVAERLTDEAELAGRLLAPLAEIALVEGESQLAVLENEVLTRVIVAASLGLVHDASAS